MDKTISISLGGFSFIVDDSAFNKLKNYLDEIRRSLHGMEGTDDILSDVEVRIAELFKERMGAREVVDEYDVDYVVGIMGRPEQFVDEDNENSGSTSSDFRTTGSPSGSDDKVKRKLYRDPNDKIIAGVLSGLAHYFGIEPWITRVLWIVIFFSDIFVSGTSFTIISYIILWIILPRAETATQKYEMYGQAGDFETIKKNASQAASEISGVAREATPVIGKIFRVLGTIFLAFIGISLIFAGIGLIIGAIALLITSTTNGIPSEIFDYVVDYQWQDTISKILLMVLMIIPALLLILFGTRLISDRVKISKTFVFSSLGVWLLALISATVLALSLAKNYSRDIEYTDKKAYTIENDTIKLSFNAYKNSRNKKLSWIIDDDLGGFIQFDGKLIRQIDDEIEIRQANNDQVFVELVYYSKGSSMDNARDNAEEIDYAYTVSKDGELNFNDYLSLPEGAKFRDQNVRVIVYIPKNKVIHSTNIDDLIFYDEELNDTNYENGNNKFYKFDLNQFLCTNCEWEESQDKPIIIEGDSAKVEIGPEGVQIHGKDGQVIINKQKISISDGTDSVNINVSDN